MLTRTWLGKAWCENLERYSDFANRLPRGRTYVRNGSVIDLQIAPGEIKALVSGSEIYKVVVKVAPVTEARWRSICRDSAGAIDSLIELLQGRFSKGVMERVCRQKTGLSPSPDEIKLSCSCRRRADRGWRRGSKLGEGRRGDGEVYEKSLEMRHFRVFRTRRWQRWPFHGPPGPLGIER